MKSNVLLAPWKGDKRFTAMAKRAAALKKQRHTAEQIVAAITAEFGPPPAKERLRDRPAPLTIVGQVGVDIEGAAVAQIELALRLPIAVRGALMPDAHVGYALPVGGVLAAHRAVAPGLVGVDIGCRMHLSIFAEPPAGSVMDAVTATVSDGQTTVEIPSARTDVASAYHGVSTRYPTRDGSAMRVTPTFTAALDLAQAFPSSTSDTLLLASST